MASIHGFRDALTAGHVRRDPTFRHLQASALREDARQAGCATLSGRALRAKADALAVLGLARGPGLTCAFDLVFGRGAPQPSTDILTSARHLAGLEASTVQHTGIPALCVMPALLGWEVAEALGRFAFAIVGASNWAESHIRKVGDMARDTIVTVGVMVGLAVKVAYDAGVGLFVIPAYVAARQFFPLALPYRGPLPTAGALRLQAQQAISQERLALTIPCAPRSPAYPIANSLFSALLVAREGRDVYVHETTSLTRQAAPALATAVSLQDAAGVGKHTFSGPVCPIISFFTWHSQLARTLSSHLAMPQDDAHAATTAAWVFDVSDALSGARLESLAQQLGLTAPPTTRWSRAWRQGPAVRVELHSRWDAQDASARLRLTLDVLEPSDAMALARVRVHSAEAEAPIYGPEPLTA